MPRSIPSPAHPASPDDIDIAGLWSSLLRSLPRIAVLSAAAGALTYGLLSTMAPRYTSEAQLAVVAKGAQNPFADPRRDAAAPDAIAVRVDKEAINTHVRALMSPDLARRIAEEMQLAGKVEFNTALGHLDTFGRLSRMVGMGGVRAGESEADRVLGAFFKSLEVYSPKESRFIGVRFTSADPALAADVANRIAETYRASLATMRVSETDEVQKALGPKIGALVKEVATAEAEVERFRGKADRFVGGPQRTALIEQQLGELTAELSRTSAARSEVEARAKAARELVRSGSADVLPDVQRSPLIQNLVQQRVRVERQIAELSATLLPGHPRMQQLNADLAGLKRQIGGEVGKLVESLEKEAKSALSREESVTRSIDLLKSRVVSTGGDDVKLRQLEAEARSKRAELERLQAQFEANKARATPGAVPVEAQIITQARASSVPTFPRKGPYAALVAAAALLFGIAWVISKALFVGARQQHLPAGGTHGTAAVYDDAAAPMRPTAVRPAAAASAPAAPTASRAAVPQKPAGKAKAETAKAVAKGLAAAEPLTTIDALAARLATLMPGNGGYRALVVGETNSVDAAAEAGQLARALASAGRNVILVDWALDGAGMAVGLGVQRTPGLTDLLQGAASFEDVIRRDPQSEVHVLASGGAMATDDADVDPDQLNLVLDALDEAYDVILVAGRHEPVRELFELIQGRFDAGITVSEARKRQSVLQDPPGTLLGFEVTDIHVLHYERRAATASTVQRLLRGAGRGPAELRAG